MTTDATLVQVAATGAIYMSTIGATAPTNATAAWSTAWGEFGYIGEDGFTENPSMDNEEIKAWQSGAIVRRVITGSGLEFSFMAIETNLRTLDLFYPGSVITAVTGPPVETRVDVKAPVVVPKAFGFDVIDGTKRTRIVVPRATLTDRGEVQNANGNAIGYDYTLNAEPDASGILAVKYYNPQLT